MYNEKEKLFLKKISDIVSSHICGYYKLFVFGSRANGTHKSRSDRDIWYLAKEKLERTKLSKIKNDIDELPYFVDFVDFSTVPKSFQNIAISDIVQI